MAMTTVGGVAAAGVLLQLLLCDVCLAHGSSAHAHAGLPQRRTAVGYHECGWGTGWNEADGYT